jgi:hypothetical protein
MAGMATRPLGQMINPERGRGMPMRLLIRNITPDRHGKYGVVRMQKLPDDPGRRADVDFALRTLEANGMLEWGDPGTENEFFVIMLKDIYAAAALKAYATEIINDVFGDSEYADDVLHLAKRAGPDSRWCKKPD